MSCYDPMASGARCDRCVLFNGTRLEASLGQRPEGWKPVPSEFHDSPIIVVAESPDERDEEEMRPLMGPPGMEAERALRAVGLKRPSVSWAHAIACKPPKNEMKKLLRRVDQIRKRERREGVPEVDITPTPMECCAPRLEADLKRSGAKFGIPMGKWAAKALVPGMQGSITGIRGNLVDLSQWPVEARPGGLQKVLPTVHPTFVLKSLRWRRPFQRDISRAVRWFRGNLHWVEPTVTYTPTANELEAWLYAKHAGATFFAYDVETDAIEPMIAKLRCLGISTEDDAIVIPFLSVDGETRFYDPEEEWRIVEVLRHWLTDPNVLKVGHNAGWYDRLVAEQPGPNRATHALGERPLGANGAVALGVTPAPLLDSIMVHKAVDPELPHSLAFCGSYFSDVHAWKADHTATTAQSDGDLWKYNALDCIVNARIMAEMAEIANKRRQTVSMGNGLPSVLDMDHAMQDVCCTFHRLGMYADPDAVQTWRKTLEGQVLLWRLECRKQLGAMGIDAMQVAKQGARASSVEELQAREELADVGLAIDPNEFNPGSYPQVRVVLFGIWDLALANDVQEQFLFTETGARSTGDAVMRAYMCDGRLTRQQKDFIHAVRRYRKAVKLLGTYVKPLMSTLADGGRMWPDGRVRSSWNAHVTPVGRLSCSGYNLQNVVGKLKNLFVAAPGNLLVGADMDQLHLRIIANLWKVQSLIDVFKWNLDPHGVFAEIVMGETYTSAPGYQGYGIKPKGKTLADNLRGTAKSLRYAGAYSAAPETIFRVLQSAEDDDGNLVNRNLKLPQVYAMHQQWMEAEPQWRLAWNDITRTWKTQRYLESPILGRRRDFLDEKETDMINYPILSAEGDLMALITVEFVKALDDLFREKWQQLYETQVALGERPPTFDGRHPWGAINQCHDSLTAEVPEEDAEAVCDLMDATMNRSVPGWPIPFTAKAEIASSWDKV